MEVSMKSARNRIARCAAAAGLALGVAAFLVAPPVWAQAAAAEPEPVVKTKTMWDMIRHGGVPLIILGVCSVATLTLIIERFMFYRRARGSAEQLLEKIKQAGTMSEALAAIEQAPGIAARVFRSALQAARDGYSAEQVEKLVEGSVTKEMIQMEKFLPQLDTMVTMCPLIGLAGTTLGMIKSFSVVAAIGMTKPEMLAGGISEALVNTAAGLLVAIPALFCYNWFTGLKEAILMDLEKGLTELMVIIRSSVQH
jgi:biopolymer transport protein ExbB